MVNFQLYSARKSYGKNTVLQDVSFKLKTGEIMGIFGRNGSGKSTLLKALTGSIKAEVKMEFDGVITVPSEVISKQLIAYLPQHPFIPVNLLVRDVIPIYYSDGKKQDAIFYDPTIVRISNTKIGALSQGERKYLETLMVGNLPHPVLMLDEPFSMLEPLQIDQLKIHLNKIKEHKAIIITDHYYHDVWDLASKYIVLTDGKSYQIEEKKDLIAFDYLKRP